MKHTLVAAFATLTDANRTRGDLMARGIPREQIHAVGAESADIHAYDAPYSTSPDVPVDRHEHESKVAHFFNRCSATSPMNSTVITRPPIPTRCAAAPW